MYYNLTKDKARALKRKAIIRKIFKRYIRQAGLEKITGLRIIDRDDFSRGSCYCRHYYDGKFKIVLDMVALYNTRIKWGYSDDYYPGRHNRLSFIIGNKKLAFRFALLHELGHAINSCGYVINSREELESNTEVNADNYAIRQLQKDGLLKEGAI